MMKFNLVTSREICKVISKSELRIKFTDTFTKAYRKYIFTSFDFLIAIKYGIPVGLKYRFYFYAIWF